VISDHFITQFFVPHILYLMWMYLLFRFFYLQPSHPPFPTYAFMLGVYWPNFLNVRCNSPRPFICISTTITARSFAATQLLIPWPVILGYLSGLLYSTFFSHFFFVDTALFVGLDHCGGPVMLFLIIHCVILI